MRLPRLATPALLAGSVFSTLLVLVSPIQRADQPFSPLDLAPAPWAGPAVLAAVALLLAAIVWPRDGPLRRAVTLAACAVLFGVLGLVAAVPEARQRAVGPAAVALGFAALGWVAQVLQARSARPAA